MTDQGIDPVLAERAIAEGLRAHPKFATMKPRLERVALFRGSTLLVRYDEDRRDPGDPDNFAFEKAVVKSYRVMAGHE